MSAAGRAGAVANPANGHVHRDEAAMRRCWGCSDPARLAYDEADVATAQVLVEDGWRSTSNKYKTVSRFRLPPFEEMFRPAASAPGWLIEDMRRAYKGVEASELRGPRAERRDLSDGEFRAFKALGGESA